jgi:hypothetical protein
MSHVTYQRVVSHITHIKTFAVASCAVCHINRVICNESCHISTSRVTHYTYQNICCFLMCCLPYQSSHMPWVMSHINESCHTIHISKHLLFPHVLSAISIQSYAMGHVTYQRVVSHITHIKTFAVASCTACHVNHLDSWVMSHDSRLVTRDSWLVTHESWYETFAIAKYRVATTHKLPHLYRTLSAHQPWKQWLIHREWSESEDMLWVSTILYAACCIIGVMSCVEGLGFKI